MTKKATAFFLIFLSPVLSYGDSGARFLKLGVGARALGLGSAFTSVADDVTSLHWNPAGLSSLKSREVSGMHAEVYADTRYDFIGYAHPTSKLNFGVGAAYLSQGNLEGRGIDRSSKSDFTANDFAVTLGAGRSVIANLNVGMSVKIIRSQIAGYNSTGFAFDLGSKFQIESPILGPEPIHFGLAVQNIGPKMKFVSDTYNLPLTLAGGISCQIARGLLISADVKRDVYDTKTNFSLGTEFSPLSFFSLRAGYITNSALSGTRNSNTSDSFSTLTGLGTGLGLRSSFGSIDYSFSPNGELGNSHRISFTYKI